MHLVRFQQDGQPQLGALRDGQIVNLTAASGGALTADMSAVLRGEGDGLDGTRRALDSATDSHAISREDVTLLAPATPGKTLCLGLNYRAHAEEAGMDIPEFPVLFNKAGSSLVGDGQNIVLPKAAPDQVDYEAELAVVIGKPARNVSREEALDYVAGYTCANDVSARDLQLRTTQWTLGKLLDTFCPLGPALVTTDEVPDPNALAIGSKLNDEEMQASNTSDMIFNVVYAIEYLSGLFTLHPGDVLLTGTPEGVGFSRKPPVFLKEGDVIEVIIEKLGTLRNPVVAES